MKKKKITVLLFIVIIIVIAGFVPFNKQVAVKVKASYFNCYQQLFTIKNWKNWNPDVSRSFKTDSSVINKSNEFKISSPEQDLLVKKQNVSTLLVRQGFKDQKFEYMLTLVPDDNGFAAIVIATFKTNLIKLLMAAIQTHDPVKMNISNFKNYMEDVKQYYGFNIKQGFDLEKNTIVKTKTIAAGNIYHQVAEIETQLHHYISANHLNASGLIIAQFYKKTGDSLQMIIGMQVDKEIKTANGFTYMLIPATKVLTAGYNGRYRDKQKIYTAMSTYLQDRFLHPKIAPLEYFKNKFPTADSDTAGFQLCYPIF